MESIQAPSDLVVYICSKNPIAIWVIKTLRTSGSSTWHFDTWLPIQLVNVSHGVHVLLIDVSSVTEWPEVVHKWASSGNRAIVLVPEGWGSGGAELRALHIGVRGIVYVSNDFGERLTEAVNLVARGQLFASAESLDEFYSRHRRLRSGPSRPYLSFREEQVIDLLMKEFSNRRIARVLGISERTAKFHVCNILHKLQVKNRRDLMGRDSQRDWSEKSA